MLWQIQLTLPWGDRTITHQPRYQVFPHQSPWKGWGHLWLTRSECYPSPPPTPASTAGAVSQRCPTPRALYQKLPTVSCNCLSQFISDFCLAQKAELKRTSSESQADLALMLTRPCDLGQRLQNRCVTSSFQRLKQEFLLCLLWCRKSLFCCLIWSTSNKYSCHCLLLHPEPPS